MHARVHQHKIERGHVNKCIDYRGESGIVMGGAEVCIVEVVVVEGEKENHYYNIYI